MGVENVLTNDFEMHYDERTNRLLIYALDNGKRPAVPIALKSATLQEMGPEKAAEWLGKTILLLIPAMRSQLFRLQDAQGQAPS